MSERFDKYTIRNVDPDRDEQTLADWIARDPFHCGVMTPELFLGLTEKGEPDPRPSCFAVEDIGGQVFFLRVSRAARIYVQFNGNETQRARYRTSMAMVKTLAYLEPRLGRIGAEQWIFDTMHPGLRKMTESRLGFKRSQNEMVREIAARAEV